RRHTRSYGDWSSDVCSSDLEAQGRIEIGRHRRRAADMALDPGCGPADLLGVLLQEVGQAAAESASAAACRRGMRRRLTRTMPAKIGRASCRESGEIAEGDG